jgi:hypothetical protein
MYAPPTFVYTLITSRYESVMITRIVKTTAVIGIKIEKAAKPNAGSSAIKICSDPYAEEEIQSEDKIPNA